LNHHISKNNFILFSQLYIEAFDSKSPNHGKTSTTIQFDLIKSKQVDPFFVRDEFASALTLTVADTFPVFTPFYDLTTLVSLPFNQSIVYFYVYNNAFPFEQSDTVYVDSFDLKLKLKQRLNAKLKSVYRLFVLVAKTPLGPQDSIRQPSNANKALLFIDLIVSGVHSESALFLDATLTMCKLDFFLKYFLGLFFVLIVNFKLSKNSCHSVQRSDSSKQSTQQTTSSTCSNRVNIQQTQLPILTRVFANYSR